MKKIALFCYLIILCFLINPNVSIADNMSDSEKLFNFAEQSYSQYFSPIGAKTFPLENYLVRYYSETDTYLGTRDGDVYVYGTIFGGLLKVGKISDFVDISPPASSKGALFLTKTPQTISANVKIDKAGGMHVAYASYSSESPGAFYSYCNPASANCEQPATWSTVSLSPDGSHVSEVQLQLTPEGQPRLLIKTIIFSNYYQYAACDVDCTNPGNWALLNLATYSGNSSSLDWQYGQNYFALDTKGRPRFIFQETSNYLAHYVYCDVGCTDITNWYQTQLSRDGYDQFSFSSLAFTADDQPRIVAFSGGSSSSLAILEYHQCNGNCENSANWQRVSLYDRGYGLVFPVLRLNSNGQPRLLFNQGDNVITGKERLYYIWCNGDCLNSGNWGSSDLGLPDGIAPHFDLFIDKNDQPHFAFQKDSGPSYARCTANCESTNGVWQMMEVESTNTLNQEFPIDLGLDCNISSWAGGYRPSLALDGTGNPRIAYDAEHFQGREDFLVDGVCDSHVDYKAARLIFFNRSE